MEAERILMHDVVVYNGNDYRFGYYSTILGKAVIYKDCSRHGRDFYVVEITEIERKYK